jgi:hypothetical protein
MHSVHYCLNEATLTDVFSDMEIFSALVAAAGDSCYYHAHLLSSSILYQIAMTMCSMKIGSSAAWFALIGVLPVSLSLSVLVAIGVGLHHGLCDEAHAPRDVASQKRLAIILVSDDGQ